MYLESFECDGIRHAFLRKSNKSLATSLISLGRLRIVKSLLPLPVVPIERPRNAVDPVLFLPVEGQDGGEGEARGGDRDVVAGFQLASTCTSC